MQANDALDAHVVNFHDAGNTVQAAQDIPRHALEVLVAEGGGNHDVFAAPVFAGGLRASEQ